jgi:hypothetical protein
MTSGGGLRKMMTFDEDDECAINLLNLDDAINLCYFICIMNHLMLCCLVATCSNLQITLNFFSPLRMFLGFGSTAQNLEI